MNQPLISIIIPTFNRANLIKETLNSVLKQTYQNWECIVVDDGSTDNTKDIVDSFINKDARFKFYKRAKERRPGGNGARNYGFIKSKGAFVKWLDSDDIIGNELLEKEIDIINKKGVDLVYSNWQFFDSNNTVYEIQNLITATKASTSSVLLNSMGKLDRFNVPSSYLIKRETILVAGLWNEFIKVNQDGEFFCRIICNSNHISALDYTGSFYRNDSGNQISKIRDNRNFILRLKVWEQIFAYLHNIENEDFSEYIVGTKNHLYRVLKAHNKINIIDKYKLFFKEQINAESDKKLKIKIITYKLLKFLGYFK